MPERKTLERVARHEAGHAMVAWLGDNAPVQVTIVGRGHAGGYMERESDEDRMIYTKSELEQRICESMGGRAAEILYYGNEEGLSSGVASDLQHATDWATRMVREFGMAEDFGQVALDGEQRLHDGPLAIKVSEAAEHIVKEQLDRAIKLLEDNKKYLDLLSEKLLEENRLTKEDLGKILQPLGKKGKQ